MSSEFLLIAQHSLLKVGGLYDYKRGKTAGCEWGRLL